MIKNAEHVMGLFVGIRKAGHVDGPDMMRRHRLWNPVFQFFPQLKNRILMFPALELISDFLAAVVGPHGAQADNLPDCPIGLLFEENRSAAREGYQWRAIGIRLSVRCGVASPVPHGLMLVPDVAQQDQQQGEQQIQ